MRAYLNIFLFALAVSQICALPALSQRVDIEPECKIDGVTDPDLLIATCTTQLNSSANAPRQVELLVARASGYASKHQPDRAIADLSRALAPGRQ